MPLQACYRPNMEPSPALQGLQQLQKALQELPRKWLSGHTAQEDDYLQGTVTGECNYNFSLKVEGGGFFQTGMLVANAVRANGGMPIPMACKWKRRVGDHSVEIQGASSPLSSNMYQISADDVGTHICVEARPADSDDGLWGAVMGEIGPFELDPATRRNLDNALGLGGSKFQVKQPAPRDDSGQGQDFIIHVCANGVRVVPVSEGRSSREISVDYAPDYPRVIIHPLDTYKFDLVMSERQNLHLLAPSRAARDLIALTIRCLHTNRFVPTSDVLNALLPQQPLVQQAGLPTVDGRLDACIRLERLLKELNQAMLQKETSEKVLRNTKLEKKQLQEQLQESISGCTDVIVGLQEQFQEGPAVGHALPVEQQRELLQEAQAQCESARAELQKARRRFEEVRQSAKVAEEAKPLVQRSREERDMLRSKMAESSVGSQAQQDQADQSHALELKRLRQDVETLHNKKEQLRRQLQDKEAEKQELQDNFFYVKGQLDKWQLRVAQDADGEGAVKELERHHHTLSTAKEERTRLSARLENLLRDTEKEKVYHEQQLERVMQANGRLTEEKDRSQREVQRLSKMYSDSVQQLGAEAGGPAGNSDAFAADAGDMMGFADPDEVARVRAMLLQVDEKLKQKQSENESLRNRIRKLAVE